MQIKIEGIDNLRGALDIDTTRALRAATKGIAGQIEHEIKPYPPSSRANRPGGPGSRWYERGYGPRWRRVDGSIGGRRTSETLGRRWSISGWGRIGAVLRNIASYAVYVHEQGKQAAIHHLRGWVTDEEAVKEVLASGKAGRILEAAIRRNQRR